MGPGNRFHLEEPVLLYTLPREPGPDNSTTCKLSTGTAVKVLDVINKNGKTYARLKDANSMQSIGWAPVKNQEEPE